VKFLVAVDGSENSVRAVSYAVEMVQHYPESHITLLYVDTLATVLSRKGAEFPSNFEDVRGQAVKQALVKAEKILLEKSIPFKTKVLEGFDIAETVSEYAKEKGFDQIILGTRGLGNLSGIVMGSVSHKILHLSPCPVTLVK